MTVTSYEYKPLDIQLRHVFILKYGNKTIDTVYLKNLLDDGANPNGIVDEVNNTPFFYAVAASSVLNWKDVLALLLDYGGADKEHRNIGGFDFATIAKFNGNSHYIDFINSYVPVQRKKQQDENKLKSVNNLKHLYNQIVDDEEDMPDKTDLLLLEVKNELLRATELHGSFHTRHEAIAVILEEYLEAQTETFKKNPDLKELRKEYIQIAAMCLRAIKDLNL